MKDGDLYFMICGNQHRGPAARCQSIDRVRHSMPKKTDVMTNIMASRLYNLILHITHPCGGVASYSTLHIHVEVPAHTPHYTFLWGYCFILHFTHPMEVPYNTPHYTFMWRRCLILHITHAYEDDVSYSASHIHVEMVPHTPL